MNIHEELWKAFNDIYFEEGPHTYTDSLGTQYESATGWISRFSEPFNTEERLKSSSEETGTPIEELRKQWDYAGEYARKLGTEVHSVMENLWYKKDYDINPTVAAQFPEMVEDFNERKRKCKDLFRRMKRIYAPVANEFIVYDQEHGICGTIDMLAYNMKTGKYAIIDWKTSKAFKTVAWNDERLKEPFTDIQACNTAEYSLQLSLYKYMLEKKTSIRVDELLLFQIPGKTKAVGDIHRCFDLSDRLKKYIEG